MLATDPRRLGRAAGALVVAAAALLVLTAAAGPSAIEPGLGPRTGWRGVLPPYSADLHLSSAVVTVLVVAAYLAGGVGVALGLLAVHRGDRVDPRRVLQIGVLLAVAAVLVPPVGSADHINYAAYGRIAAQGGDPYAEAPALWHGGHDPVTSAVEPPWTTTPSIYGPVATAVQAATSLGGGDSLRATVWLWQLLCAGAWLLVGWLLLRFVTEWAGDGSAAQSRAGWLWIGNPVLYGVGLLGAHIDIVAAALVLVALLLALRQPFWGGVALGAATGMKLTMVLAVPALLWGLRGIGRHRLLRAGALGLVGAALVLVPAHLWAGSHVFDEIQVARRYISLATPWRPVFDLLKGSVGNNQLRDWIVRLAPVVVLLLAIGLARIARRARPPEDPRATDAEPARVVSSAAVALVVLFGAYLLGAPYSLPWYDAAVWAPLALLAPGPLDAVLLVRLVSMAVAYVPGRVIGMSPTVQRVTLDYRKDVTPYVGWLLLVAVAVLAGRRRAPTR